MNPLRLVLRGVGLVFSWLVGVGWKPEEKPIIPPLNYPQWITGQTHHWDITGTIKKPSRAGRGFDDAVLMHCVHCKTEMTRTNFTEPCPGPEKAN